MQLKYDCPTSELKSYGRFLRQIDEQLPPGTRLSITALLDWFRPGTEVKSTIAAVDEFVPQFYDVRSIRMSSGIAEPIEAAKWAGVFNAFKTPYKIGISTFGRIARRRLTANGSAVQYFRAAAPLDFSQFGFHSSTSNTPAGEFIVRYEVRGRPARPDLQPGDVVEITFPTEVSVRRAYESALQFGGYSSGALFSAGRQRRKASRSPPAKWSASWAAPRRKPELEIRDGFCLERRCADLYLHLSWDPAAPQRVVQIAAGSPMELFVPSGPLSPATFDNQVSVRVPAHSGLRSIHLGRVISKAPLQFEVIHP